VPENIALAFELAATGSIALHRTHLEQIALNLAANARDAMPGGGRLRIATADEPNGDQIRITFTDDGAGMDAATRRRAFEPFFTTKAVGLGTGLGLSTIYAIVIRAGGAIALDSEPGAGTTVTLRLPRGEVVPAAARVRAGSPTGLPGLALLVEDDPLLRRASEQILRDLGLTVVAAASAAEVPRALGDAGRQPDVLVTDVVMPGPSGLALAAELRAGQPDLAVVFLSGYSEERVADAASAPLTRFLAKPFTPDALALVVREVLAEREAARRDAASPAS
jgi:CheY-like chemotaxis protein